MSSVSRDTAAVGAPRRTYITMRTYNNDIFSYTTTPGVYPSFITTGTLSLISTATSSNCLQGAFLRETGRRIYPGAHPGISTMMVNVFDFATGLNGFIDPNSFAFTPQNTDRSYYIDSAGYNPNPADAPLRNDQGPPVYTHGDILADGNMYIGGSASTMKNAYFNSSINVAQSTITNNLWTGAITAGGPIKFSSPTNVGFGQNGAGTSYTFGSFRKTRVTGTNYISGVSHVQLTLTGINNPGFLSVEPTGTDGSGNTIPYVQGTFWVVSNNTSDQSTFSYVIINQ